MTNPNPLLELGQQAASYAGYNLSGGEITLIVSATGTVVAGLVHYAHLAVYACGRAGGWEGVKRFVRTGSTAVVAGPSSVNPPSPLPSPQGEGVAQVSPAALAGGTMISPDPHMKGPLGL
jgi:hypothetical protein